MNIDVVLKNAATSRKWLESKDGDAVRQFLTQWRNSTLVTLSTSSDQHEVFLAQGRLQVLNRILGLPDEIRLYQDNVRHKNVLPVTKENIRSGLILK